MLKGDPENWREGTPRNMKFTVDGWTGGGGGGGVGGVG